MRRAGLTLLVLVLGVSGTYLAASGVVSADHDGAGSHSDNMRLVANWDDGGKYRNGTDIAFWGSTAVLGRLDQGTTAAPGPGGFRLMDVSDPRNPRQFGEFNCLGDQSDVSIWRDLAIVSPDRQPTEAAAWASYWYNGAVFSNNFDEDVNSLSPRNRGLDVFEVDHPLLRKGVVRLPRLNPQVQEPLPKSRKG